MTENENRADRADRTDAQRTTFAGIRSTVRRDRWVKPFFKHYRKALAAALALGFVTYAFAALLMFTSGYLISGAAMVETILALHLPLIFVRIFGLGKPILQYIERLTSHNWVLRMTSKLRLKLYESLERDPAASHATRRTGDVLGLLAEDIGHLQDLYLRTLFPTVVALLIYAGVVAALGFFSPWIACAMLLILGVLVFVVPLVSVICNGARQTNLKALRNNLYAELTDNVLGAADWVFSQRSDDYLSLCRDSASAAARIEAEMERFSRRRDLAIQAIFAVGAAVLLVWAGAHFGGANAPAANWIAAFVLAFFPLIDAFAPLSTAAVQAGAYRDSIERLNDLPDPDAGIGAQPAGSAPSDGEPAAKAMPSSPFDIELAGVTFAYPGGRRSVLDGLDLRIPAGQKVAILGRSGAGKSTLTQILRGDLIPDAGTVRVGGADPAACGAAIAQSIGVIQQTTYLFHTTLLENLRVGNARATREDAWRVLEQVGLGDMVRRLPDGLDTMVDEAGLRFSGGERHRIALARVLLQDAPIVILDEPCAGLDPATEQALLTTLVETLAGRTLIMVTHHLEGAALMDRVIFLDGGAIGRDGDVTLDASPAELERTSPHYRTLLSFDRGFVR
mgnify:FL=1